MAKKPHFNSVDVKIDFPKAERRLMEHWYEKGIVKKYLNKNNNSKKRFSFIDGPITANNPMGVHHAWGRTYKDLWQRYKNMKGYKQRFQNGFDAQGLWVEVEVEKELGLKSKKDIENIVKGDAEASIAKFIELCKARVYKYATIQTEQSKRLGYFMDWENSYFTLSDENNYTIWHFLKKCHSMGIIYKGRDSVPWCPRCGTAISQHEMLTENYSEVTHDSVYFKLPIKERPNEYLLVWTTTPWTLPGNVAVAVDEKQRYSLVEGTTGDRFWIAEKLVEKVFDSSYKTIHKTVKGSKLVGIEYETAFDALPRVKEKRGGSFHTVVATRDRVLPISMEEGTGLVHVATGAGSEDFALGKKLGLPVVEIIDEEAGYLDGLGEFTGKNAKKNPAIILQFLGDRWIFSTEKYRHRYPTCWRCKTELVWRVVDEWYIAMDKKAPQLGDKTLREAMKLVARKIHWIPSFGLKRELDWLENMHDWLISKKRYWGLALPIWECTDCGNFELMGGKGELRQRAVGGWKSFQGKSPHRPYIDKVELECECGGKMKRIKDVGNPWLDAGIVPYSTIPGYMDNVKEWRKWFPANFITESFPGQFKNWFYSMIAMSTVLENERPYETVFGFATLLAQDGRPMHKSWGNSMEFSEGADKIGVDVMRFMYLKQNPADNLLFGYKAADLVRRQFLLKFWNVYNYFVTYANLDGAVPAGGETSSILDKWILALLKQTEKEVSENLDNFDAAKSAAALEKFVDALSNWYVRRSRQRKDRSNFYNTTFQVLGDLSKLMAPFMPFVADMVYTNMTKKASVHLEKWPDMPDLTNFEAKLLADMETLRQAVEGGHALRKKLNLPVRRPLLSFTSPNEYAVPPELEHLLLEELNVKEWKVSREAQDFEYDTKMTPELEEEAKARELLRKIQNERRKMGTSFTQKVNVINTWLPKSKKLTQKVKEKGGVGVLEKGEFRVWKP